MPPHSTVTIAPARRVSGRVRVPGDKSISHRYALLAAIAEGPSRLAHYASGADCRTTLDCLRRLGVEITEDTHGAVTVLGRGTAGLSSPDGPIDCGNSGTTMRLLAGVVAAEPFATRMAGDASLSRRPMRRVAAPLSEMGAGVETTDGHAPLTIHGARLHGIAYRPPVASAQLKSAVLFAGLRADGQTTVTETAQTRDHTERALAAFGADVAAHDLVVRLTGGQRLSGGSLDVPGDFSSAAYWMVGAAALPGSRVEIGGVGLNPTRTALVDVLRRFGARVDVHVEAVDAGEPRGTIIVESGELRGVSIAADEVPGLIDELPAIAALAAHGGEVTVRGAAELRVKESDRIAALVAGFRALGIAADEHDDGFTVGGRDRGQSRPSGGTADARHDHRMAMAFAIAALGATGPSRIDGSESVAISYPDFFPTLERLIA
jgi:3-phosphoshikimate 1-carboxyvinyltransferase